MSFQLPTRCFCSIYYHYHYRISVRSISLPALHLNIISRLAQYQTSSIHIFARGYTWALLEEESEHGLPSPPSHPGICQRLGRMMITVTGV
jgi:hypothetical protein